MPRVVLALSALFLVEFVWLGIAPASRSTWVLENVPVVTLGLALVASRRRFRLSPLSLALLLIFLCIHEVGAHYRYTYVPYDDAWRRLTGGSLNAAFGWERNHFDRLVHFLYGLLLAYPVREFYLRVVSVRGAWGYLLPLGFVVSTSAAYELLEWGAAALFGGDTGIEFLGSQADVWDAQKDMALATLGAFLALSVTLSINLCYQRDFASEWADSLRPREIQA